MSLPLPVINTTEYERNICLWPNTSLLDGLRGNRYACIYMCTHIYILNTYEYCVGEYICVLFLGDIRDLSFLRLQLNTQPAQSPLSHKKCGHEKVNRACGFGGALALHAEFPCTQGGGLGHILGGIWLPPPHCWIEWSAPTWIVSTMASAIGFLFTVNPA